MFLNFPKREGNSPGLTDGQRYRQLTLSISSSNQMSLEDTFQPQSKYNWRTFPKCDPILIYKRFLGCSGQKVKTVVTRKLNMQEG